MAALLLTLSLLMATPRYAEIAPRLPGIVVETMAGEMDAWDAVATDARVPHTGCRIGPAVLSDLVGEPVSNALMARIREYVRDHL